MTNKTAPEERRLMYKYLTNESLRELLDYAQINSDNMLVEDIQAELDERQG